MQKHEKHMTAAMNGALRGLTSHGYTLARFEAERGGIRIVVDRSGQAEVLARPDPAPAEPILDDKAVTAEILDLITAGNRIVDELQRAFVNFQAVARGLDFDFDQAMARAANDAASLAGSIEKLRRQAR